MTIVFNTYSTHREMYMSFTEHYVLSSLEEQIHTRGVPLIIFPYKHVLGMLVRIITPNACSQCFYGEIEKIIPNLSLTVISAVLIVDEYTCRGK